MNFDFRGTQHGMKLSVLEYRSWQKREDAKGYHDNIAKCQNENPMLKKLKNQHLEEQRE